MYVDGPIHLAEWLTPGNVERVDGKNPTPPNEIQDREIAGIQEVELDPSCRNEIDSQDGGVITRRQKVAVDRRRDLPRLRVIDLLPWLWLLLPSLDTLALTNDPLMDRSQRWPAFATRRSLMACARSLGLAGQWRAPVSSSLPSEFHPGTIG